MDVPIAEYLRRHAAGDPDLVAGIDALVAGDVGTAAERLRAVVECSDDPALRVRAAAYHRLATHLRWNAFPGGSGAAATEISVRWDGAPSAVDVAEDWTARTRELGDAAIRAEVRAVGGTLCALRSVRVLVAHAAVRLDSAEVEAQLAEALAAIAPLRDIDEPGYADLVSAELARRARRPDQAAALLRDAAAAYGHADDSAGLGACHLARGDWRSAPAGNPETRNLTVVTSAVESSTLDWALEGDEAGLAGLDVKGAIAAYDDAEDAFAAAGSARGLAAVALRRSYVAGLAGDHLQAARLAAEAAAGADGCGDRRGGLLARVHEALALIGAGPPTQAAPAAGPATATPPWTGAANAAGAPLPAGLTHTDGGALAAQVGAWGNGPGSFSYALGLGVLCSRGGRDWLLRRADPGRALAAHRLARALFAALGAVTDEAQSLADCGHVLHVIGDRSGAAEAYEESFGLLAGDLATRPSTAGDNRRRTVALAHTLTLLHLSRRDPSGTARAADRLRAEVGALPTSTDEQDVEQMLRTAADATLAQVAVLVPLYEGEAAREAGDREAADRRFGAAREAVRGGPFPDVDFLEAVVLGHWRRYPEALVAFQRHLDAQSGRFGFVGRVLARARPVSAEIGRRRRLQHEQAGGFLVRVRAHEAAAGHFAALEEASGPRWWAGLARPWEALSGYGAACEGLGQLDRACALHAEAVAQLERHGPRIPPAEDVAPTGTPILAPEQIYLAAARAALGASTAAAAGVGVEAGAQAGGQAGGEAGSAREWRSRAFEYAERGRARGLRDRLAAGLALVAGGSDDVVAAWHTAFTGLAVREGLAAVERASAHPDPDRLSALAEQIAAVEQTLPDREVALSEADPAFAATVAVPSLTVSADALSGELPPGTALLAYHLIEDVLLAFAVTPDGLTAKRSTVDAAAMARDLHAFSSACAGADHGAGTGTDRGRSEVGGEREAGAGERLAHILLQPFAEVLSASQRVIVVPATPARGLPWHALPWGDRPLAAGHTVSYVPSLGHLPARRVVTEAAAQPPARVLVVGAGQGEARQQLPGATADAAPRHAQAAVEAGVVAAQFADALLLVGPAVTRPAVRSTIERSPVVHVAATVQVAAGAPLLSSVLLADGQALAVYELLTGHLAAELVVLSACHPPGGGHGGEVLDLTRGLLGAGARGAVVSLWPAPARTTCVLMARFYRLLCGGVSGPEALRHAQAHVRRLEAGAEAREFAVLEAVAADPAAALDLLSPLPADPDDAGDAPSPGARPLNARVNAWANAWAAFIYIGW